MCEIIEVVNFPTGNFISCTSTDADFMHAAAIEIVYNGERFALSNFKIFYKKQCFNQNPVAPLIKLEEDVPKKFLQRGNEVIFYVKEKAYA